MKLSLVVGVTVSRASALVTGHENLQSLGQKVQYEMSCLNLSSTFRHLTDSKKVLVRVCRDSECYSDPWCFLHPEKHGEAVRAP